MNDDNMRVLWKLEEDYAFQGWDFSHIGGRWQSEPLPWDYREVVLSHLKKQDILLDIGTGGGEFLLALEHPYAQTSITEAYPPNVGLCKKNLAPLGIRVAQTYGDSKLPFENESFDIAINRHDSFAPAEVWRVLKNGGYFITQQVGGKNNVDLSYRLCKGFTPQYPNHTLQSNMNELRALGFEVLRAEEAFPALRTFDTGALVYFAKIIPWEFPDFSVDGSFDSLCDCQREIEKNGFIQSTEHRFLIVAQKA